MCSPSERTTISTLSPTSPAAAAGNNMNFKRGIAYRTTISGSTVKDRRVNAVPARTGTFNAPPDSNDETSISRGSSGRGLSFFDKITSKFSRRLYAYSSLCRLKADPKYKFNPLLLILQ